ncbi:MAG: peptidoglycan-binding domain-containing protein [Paracoccaceae bacterium]
MLLSIRNSAIAATTALALAGTIAAPAQAWGKKEQGFVAGVATAVIVDQLFFKNHNRYVAPAPTPRPVYADPAPSYSSIYRTPAAQAFNSYSREERKAIQRRLRASGYYHGGIDGAFGPGTYNAITAYARASGASGKPENHRRGLCAL